MSNFRLDRRALLRGALGGLGVGLALPLLEAFVSGNGDALASGEAFPKRFGVWFWGNGVGAKPENWVPTGTGTSWQLSPIMAPLAPVQGDITVVSGLRVLTPNDHPHGTGPAGVLTGARLDPNGNFATASLDQLVANEIGGATVNRSIEISVQRADDCLSYSEPGKANPPEHDPATLFDKLFGPTFRQPGDDAGVDPKLGLRRSVLDAVSADSTRLRSRLGASDRARLDQHFDSIRALEQRIAKLEEAPPKLDACRRPDAPLAEYPDVDGRPPMSQISRVMTDMLVMSLACDLERVFHFQFSHPVNNVLFPRATAGHHQLTHDELGEQPMVQDILRQILEEAAYFVQALKSVREGGETLLDHAAVLMMTDCSNGKSHAVDEYPLFLAGTAGGALKKGLHVRTAGENASKLGFSLLRTFGANVTVFGSDEGRVTDGLGEIEA